MCVTSPLIPVPKNSAAQAYNIPLGFKVYRLQYGLDPVARAEPRIENRRRGLSWRTPTASGPGLFSKRDGIDWQRSPAPKLDADAMAMENCAEHRAPAGTAVPLYLAS
jgi:hypothetical protein